MTHFRGTAVHLGPIWKEMRIFLGLFLIKHFSTLSLDHYKSLDGDWEFTTFSPWSSADSPCLSWYIWSLPVFPPSGQKIEPKTWRLRGLLPGSEYQWWVVALEVGCGVYTAKSMFLNVWILFSLLSSTEAVSTPHATRESTMPMCVWGAYGVSWTRSHWNRHLTGGWPLSILELASDFEIPCSRKWELSLASQAMLLTRDWAELTKGKRECQGLLWGHKLDRLGRKRVLEVVECLSWGSTDCWGRKERGGKKDTGGWLYMDLTLPSPKPHAYRMCSTQHSRLDQTWPGTFLLLGVQGGWEALTMKTYPERTAFNLQTQFSHWRYFIFLFAWHKISVYNMDNCLCSEALGEYSVYLFNLWYLSSLT